MIIFLLSLALWFLCGIESFAVLVRRMTKTDKIRCLDGEWDVWFGNEWVSFGMALLACVFLGPISLACQVSEVSSSSLYNLGFSLVAKEVIPWEIARKLEDKKPQPTPQQPQSSAQHNVFTNAINAQALSAAATQQLSLGFGQFGSIQPTKKP